MCDSTWRNADEMTRMLHVRSSRALANAIYQIAYKHNLQNAKQVNLVFAPTGAGKTTVSKQLAKENPHAITVDGVIETFEKIKEMIKAATEQGCKVSVVYIHSPGIKTAQRAIQRAEKNGVSVRLEATVNRNTQYRQQIRDAAELYKDDPSVCFDLWVNSQNETQTLP